MTWVHLRFFCLMMLKYWHDVVLLVVNVAKCVVHLYVCSNHYLFCRSTKNVDHSPKKFFYIEGIVQNSDKCRYNWGCVCFKMKLTKRKGVCVSIYTLECKMTVKQNTRSRWIPASRSDKLPHIFARKSLNKKYFD